MSLDLYPTRLYWAGGKGAAKLDGEAVKLSVCPQIFPGVVIDAIDYAPGGTVAQYMPRWGGWHEMDGAQRDACMAYLRQVFGR